jgi:hypothetical protein
MTPEELKSEIASDGQIPPCCFAAPGASLAARLYAAYNRGGNPETAGLNYQGLPCPQWQDLPENVRAKWESVAAEVIEGDSSP